MRFSWHAEFEVPLGGPLSRVTLEAHPTAERPARRLDGRVTLEVPRGPCRGGPQGQSVTKKNLKILMAHFTEKNIFLSVITYALLN